MSKNTQEVSIELTNKNIQTIKSAARKLKGSKKRAFQDEVTRDYLSESAKKAETVFGWSRESVELGLNELRTGIICIDNVGAWGHYKIEDELQQLK